MKNNKSIYIVGIFMLITMVSIGYAILTGQLNINGSAKVKAASWDIYFKNIKIKDGSVTASVTPAISDKTTVNFEVELAKPGDFYEFNVDVVNDGDLDAMIESISIIPELTVNQQKYLSYSVAYFDDVPLEVKDILHAKKTRTLKVRVEYKKNIENNELLSSDETLNVHVELKYVQADNTAKTPTSQEKDIDKTAPIIENATANVEEASKDTEIIVTFEANDENEIIDTLTENDIIVKVGGTKVTPTTKVLTSSGINSVTYNLSMTGLEGRGELTLEIDGTKISDDAGNAGTLTIITPGVTIKNIYKLTKITGNGTQVGDELAIGNEHFYVIANDGTNITMFAKYNLLVGNVCTGSYVSSCTLISNPTGIQDSTAKGDYNSSNRIGTVAYSSSGKLAYAESDIKSYVDAYQTYLENIGVDIIESRLISYNELLNLGCSGNYCSSAPSWVLSTLSYWTSTSTSDSKIYGPNGSRIDWAYPTAIYHYGVRPVIVVSTDSL